MTLALAVASATAANAAPDPVLVLLGGPGDAASRRLGGLVKQFKNLNVHRDVVFVDQRGVARSSAIGCVYDGDSDLQTYMTFLPLSAVRDCVAHLPASTDVRRYQTADFVADLEDVRRALGVAQWNLHGGSYGTRVALQYLARHPSSVRSAVLMGVVPTALMAPGPFGADADAALTVVAADCRAEARCSAAFPRFAEEVDSVARRLASGPAGATIAHPVSGRPTSVQVTRAAFGEYVRASMYTAAAVQTLPLSIHEAYLGDYTAIATASVRRQRASALEGWTGLYLAVTCPEDVARLDVKAAEVANRHTTLGDDRLTQHVAACALWPKSDRKDTWPATDRITAPVLMIVGEADPATPPHWAQGEMRNMTRGQLLIVPHGGHGMAGLVGVECVDRVMVDFIATAQAVGADCVRAIRRPPFATAR